MGVNAYLALNVPLAAGVGTPLNVATMDRGKTLVVSGAALPAGAAYTLEGSSDVFGDPNAEWDPVLVEPITSTNPGGIVFDAQVEQLRVRNIGVTVNPAPSMQIGAGTVCACAPTTPPPPGPPPFPPFD